MLTKLIESEKALERAGCSKVKELGGFPIKLLSSLNIGLPDRLFLLPGGRAYFVEFKTTGKKPTKIQLVIHQRLEALGFPVTVIDSTQTLNDFIRIL